MRQAREGDDSAWRRDGVGGTTSLVNDLLKVGVWIVRLAGRRFELFGGMAIGDGASKWCFEVVSTTEAVAIGGRDCEGGGIRKDKFLRLRARRCGESGRVLCGNRKSGGGCASSTREVNFGYETGMAEGDSGEELGEISPPPGESKGEIVVVGEDSVEAEVIDETLSRCGEGTRRVLTGTWVGY